MGTDTVIAAQPLVLVVEDYEELRGLLKACLTHSGFRVLGFNSGDDVLTAPRATLMDARFALVDDAFPGNLTGPQTVALLHYINPKLKIFPMSGRPFQGWEMELMESHYRHCLAKPFGVKELLLSLEHPASTASLRNRLLKHLLLGKIPAAVAKFFCFALIAVLFGLALHSGVGVVHFSRAISWEVVFHWLVLAVLAGTALMAFLATITVAIFAFNTDLQTRDGRVSLLCWLFGEAMAVAGLFGLAALTLVVIRCLAI
jgi:CheY-like chemotaxis protein